MPFFTSCELADVRADPDAVVALYDARRTAFLAHPGVGSAGWSSTWSEDQIKLAFCCVFAYENSTYGAEPSGIDVWALPDLLNAATLTCITYVTVMWKLAALLGVDTDNQKAVGVNGGYAGNHVQLLTLGTVPVLMDPTIGFMVTGVSFNSLFRPVITSGVSVPASAFVSFYFRTELAAFKQTISEALYFGYYKPSDLLYVMSKLSNWTSAKFGLFSPQKWVVQP